MPECKQSQEIQECELRNENGLLKGKTLSLKISYIADSKRKQARLQVLSIWTINETKLLKGNNVSKKNCKNASSNKGKEYCKL